MAAVILPPAIPDLIQRMNITAIFTPLSAIPMTQTIANLAQTPMSPAWQARIAAANGVEIF